MKVTRPSGSWDIVDPQRRVEFHFGSAPVELPPWNRVPQPYRDQIRDELERGVLVEYHECIPLEEEEVEEEPEMEEPLEVEEKPEVKEAPEEAIEPEEPEKAPIVVERFTETMVKNLWDLVAELDSVSDLNVLIEADERKTARELYRARIEELQTAERQEG